LEIALRANTAHGLPLTRAERRHGVDKLIELRPAWSNRRIADAAGVGDATVRRRREALDIQAPMRPPSPTTHLAGRRTGRDGKQYPARRVDLADLVRAHPTASDRQIARLAGCSPTTVATWRRRSMQSDQPTSAGQPSVLAGVVRRILAWIHGRLRRSPRPTQ
jgi:hypothetical protein